MEEDVQRCMNLMEAMQDVAQDVRNYRTHCTSICACITALHPLLLRVASQNLLPPDQTAKNLFQKFNSTVEKAIELIRIVSNLTTLDKMMNRAIAKRQLQMILQHIQMVSNEMECFLEYQMKSNSLQWKQIEAIGITSNHKVGCHNNGATTSTQSSNIELPDLIDFNVDDDSTVTNVN